ncbi:hypothetical protein CFP56_008027 [Quercus suber]|uniref:Uncharacterized protein n=1 Tax=Quercus suber TaxID=58331 RepID=A0AAW0L4N3_QUESU|nr:hypothetical protein CFP56_53016 [Quercus suber]
MEGSRDQESSPLIATIQDIQKRLIRPSSLNSPPPQISSPKKKKKKKQLEDYLDPVLLSAISSKIGRVKKQKVPLLPEMKKKLVMVKDFEWPVDELNAFVADASRSDQVVDLNNDFIEEESEESCTPFRRFEQSALKRFKELDQP